MDSYRIPYHGINEPHNENPINLFQRQLKIEELSFELSHDKYKKQIQKLIEIGKASELASSHRVILHWMSSLETVIAEQQRIALRKGNLSSDMSKPGFLILQMPSEKIASLCVMNLMKNLFSTFVTDIESKQKEDVFIFDTKAINSTKVGIKTVKFVDEIGELFNKELKSYLTDAKMQGNLKEKIIKHHLVDTPDIGSLARDTKYKIGAFLTNMMCNNLTFSVGKKKYLLLES